MRYKTASIEISYADRSKFWDLEHDYWLEWRSLLDTVPTTKKYERLSAGLPDEFM